MGKRIKCAAARSRARSRDPGPRSGSAILIWAAVFVLSVHARSWLLNFKPPTLVEHVRALKLYVYSTGMCYTVLCSITGTPT